MVLVFTDIVRSVDLKQKLGDAAAASLINRHDNIFKQLIKTFIGARTIKDTGDGFLAEFPTTSDAVRFALKFQYAVAKEPWGNVPLKVRVGVHLGEVSELDREERTGLSKLSGLAVDLTARVMGLAAPNQILLTRAAFDGARQYIRLHPLAEEGEAEHKELALKWMAHGSYIFQGSDEPMEVFEVGPEGIAPLLAPPDSEKARRSVAAEDEETLGWRPAAGLPIPMRAHWSLESKLGEGGFGEVWLGVHDRTGERRVFKFCFDAEKLRSLKRELVLFRLLRQVLGDRQDIAKLYEVQLDEPPFFLESEFTEDGSLSEWAKNQGGLEKVPLATRLDVMARVADAVAAAHSVGVLHKDIKPGNILVYRAEDGSFRPRLTDFGIGVLTDLARFNTGTMSIADLNVSVLTESMTAAGTRMYSPPELLAGRPYTIQGDIYSLGVMLYQIVVGNFEKPLAQGWEREVTDPLLREDISRCVQGNEQDRLDSAKELADRLRSLPQRRKARRRKRVTRVTAYGSVLLTVLLVLAISAIAHERRMRLRAETAEATTDEVNEFMNETMAEADFLEGSPEGATIVEVVRKAAARLDEHNEFKDRPEIEAELRATIGRILRKRSQIVDARPHLERALELRKALYPGDHPDVAESIFELAAWHYDMQDYARAETMYKEALAMRERLFGAEHESIADSLNHLAACVDKLERHTEAQNYYKRALDMRRKLFGNVHEDVAASLNNYATCLRSQGKYEEAEPYFREALAIIQREEVRGPDHAICALAMHTLATCLIELGKLDEAEQLLEHAIKIKRDKFPAGNPSLATSIDKLAYAKIMADSASLEDVLPLCNEALKIRREAFKARPNHQSVVESAALLAYVQLKLGRSQEAQPLIDEVVAGCHARMRTWQNPDNIELLGVQLSSLKRPEEAEPLLLTVFDSVKNGRAEHRDEVLHQVIAMYKQFKPELVPGYESQLATRSK